MATCLLFVFAALIEYSMVNVLARRQLRKEQLAQAVQAFKTPIRKATVAPVEETEVKETVRGKIIILENLYR